MNGIALRSDGVTVIEGTSPVERPCIVRVEKRNLAEPASEKTEETR